MNDNEWLIKIDDINGRVRMIAEMKISQDEAVTTIMTMSADQALGIAELLTEYADNVKRGGVYR